MTSVEYHIGSQYAKSLICFVSPLDRTQAYLSLYFLGDIDWYVIGNTYQVPVSRPSEFRCYHCCRGNRHLDTKTRLTKGIYGIMIDICQMIYTKRQNEESMSVICLRNDRQ